jgi:hypothetical protein
MRIISHMPGPDDKKHSDLISEQWVPVKEPKSIIAAILLSIPIMVAMTFIVLYVTSLFVPVSLKNFGIDYSMDPFYMNINLLLIPAAFFLVVIHELLHLVMVPNFLRSDKTFLGFSYFGAFVSSEEIITRPRFIAISILPFIVISIVLPALLGVLGLYFPLVIFFVWANAVGSSVDILNLIIVLSQAPSRSYITSNGAITYWKAINQRPQAP